MCSEWIQEVHEKEVKSQRKLSGDGEKSSAIGRENYLQLSLKATTEGIQTNLKGRRSEELLSSEGIRARRNFGYLLKARKALSQT